MSRNIGWITGLAVAGWLSAGSAAWAAAACCGEKVAVAPADAAKVAAPACAAGAVACTATDGAACKAEGGACKAGECACKTAAAPAAEAKAQTLCPVMNAPVNPKLYVDADGKRIYACCRGCIGKIQADPQKYIRQLEAQGVVLEKVPTT